MLEVAHIHGGPVLRGSVRAAGAKNAALPILAAALTGAAGAVATCSGTTALHLMLHVAGVKPGDLVVLPTLTFIASANAIAHCGATPWLFDVDSTSWTLDAAAVASAFARDVALDAALFTVAHVLTASVESGAV